MAAIFQGIQVLDFSQGMAGSLATMILTDYGAEVVKVEPPAGDPFRSMPAWRMWNRGKQGVVLDLETQAGRQAELGMAQNVPPDTTGRRPDTINLTYLVVRTGDGLWLQMTNLAARLFPNWMRAIGLEHIFEDPRFQGAPTKFATVEDRAELR